MSEKQPIITQEKGKLKGRCPNYETVFYSRFTTLNLKARLKRERLTPEESRQIESVYREKHERFGKSISMKRLTSFILVLVFVLTSMPFTPITADTQPVPQPGEITISKTAVPTNIEREFEITLTAKGKELTTQVPVDVVLVLDTSYSMNDRIDGVKKLDIIKAAAKEFVDAVFIENELAKIGIVSYDTNARTHTLSSRQPALYDESMKKGIEASINSLNTGFYTNIQAGFREAGKVLEKGTAAEKIVVMMTDGQPNRSINAGGQIVYNGNHINRTIAEGKSLKDKFGSNSVNIYNVGFIASVSGDEANNIKRVLDPEGDNKYHKGYFEATDIASLNNAFEDISEQLSYVANNARIVDNIHSDFTLVGTPEGAIISNKGQTLAWDIGDIKDDEVTRTFKVRAKDGVYGAAYTNESAYLYFDTPAENPVYGESVDNSLEYNKPVVLLAPKAKDDVFSVNAGKTVDLDSVLTNDRADLYCQTGVIGWTTSDLIAVKVTDSSHITNFSEDGTFKFTSAVTDEGPVTFKYNIQTTVKEGNDTVGTVLSSEGEVTINLKYPVDIKYFYRKDDSSFDASDTFYYASGTEINNVDDPEHVDGELTDYLALVDNDSTKLPYTVIADNNVIERYYESIPQAVEDEKTIYKNEASVLIDVLDNDKDHWGDDLSIVPFEDPMYMSADKPNYGSAIIENGKIRYTPGNEYTDNDTFIYYVSDNYGQTAKAEVIIKTPPYYLLSLNMVDIQTGKLIQDVIDNPLVLDLPSDSDFMINKGDYPIIGYDSLGIVTEPLQAAYALRSYNLALDDDDSMLPDIYDLIDSETILAQNEGDLERILVYRRSEVAYTVNHYYEYDEELIGSDILAAQFKDEITEDNVTNYAELPEGFERSRVVFPDGNESLIISTEIDDNVIRVYYSSIPVAEDDEATTLVNVPVTIDVLDNDSDPLGGILTVIDVTNPDNAQVEINEDGTITVTPDEDFIGTITFEYTMMNEEERTASAIVTVTVEAPTPTPTPTPVITIEVTESEPPLAPPATPTPTPVPTIEVIETKPPLAEPTPTVPTIEVEQEELPKAGERAPLWPIGMAMLLIAGGLTFMMHRKDKTEQ